MSRRAALAVLAVGVGRFDCGSRLVYMPVRVPAAAASFFFLAFPVCSARCVDTAFEAQRRSFCALAAGWKLQQPQPAHWCRSSEHGARPAPSLPLLFYAPWLCNVSSVFSPSYPLCYLSPPMQGVLRVPQRAITQVKHCLISLFAVVMFLFCLSCSN